MVPPTGEMPKKVYTVGDTIRLDITFRSVSNIDEVHAFYQRQETISFAEGVGRDISQSPFSFEGTVEETTIFASDPYALPLKQHTATLLSLVDRDHVPGSYNLIRLRLRTAGGKIIDLEPDPGDQIESFRIAAESPNIQAIEARFTIESEDD